MSASLCSICGKIASRYTCPRCNIQYCGSECYKSQKHLKCSEQFYQECIYNELKLQSNDPATKAKTYELLQKHMEDINEDLSFSSDLFERLDGVDLDDVDTVLSKLTPQEVDEFERNLQIGAFRVELHSPWWTKTISEDDSHLPQILDSLQPFHTICKNPPAKGTVPQIISILTAYVVCVRLYNGDHQDWRQECSKIIFDGCPNILSPIPQSGDSWEEFLSTLDRICSKHSELGYMAELKVGLGRDVLCLLPRARSDHSTRALSDVHRLLGRKSVNNKSAQRRLYFLICWSLSSVDVLAEERNLFEKMIEMFERDRNCFREEKELVGPNIDHSADACRRKVINSLHSQNNLNSL